MNKHRTPSTVIDSFCDMLNCWDIADEARRTKKKFSNIYCKRYMITSLDQKYIVQHSLEIIEEMQNLQALKLKEAFDMFNRIYSGEKIG